MTLYYFETCLMHTTLAPLGLQPHDIPGMYDNELTLCIPPQAPDNLLESHSCVASSQQTFSANNHQQIDASWRKSLLMQASSLSTKVNM